MLLLAAPVHRWDPALAVDAFVADELGARTAAMGPVPTTPAPAEGAEGALTCGVCYDPCPESQRLPCGHAFCAEVKG